MAEKLYQVIFDASLTGEFDLETTKRKIEKLFSLKQSALKRLFSGKPLVIKKNLCEDDAMQFAMRIAEAGCECVIERVLGEGSENLEENRKPDERRMRFRRNPRPGAIVPDRRRNIRRLDDAEDFEELILNQADIPIGFGSYPTIIKDRD